MRLGFSYVGLLYLIMLMVPNMVWAKHKPENYERYAGNENRLLLALERIGEVLVSCTALIFSDFNLRPWTLWCVWLIISFALMILYEIYWIRYFASGHKMKDMYRGICGIPVAGASLPVAAFFLLGVYGVNFPMMLFSVILGIGHIGIHLAHAREAAAEEGAVPRRKSLPRRIIRGIIAAVSALALVVTSAAVFCRDANHLCRWTDVINGVDEQGYIDLNGQEQYVMLTGSNTDNPVVIYLHGGPASPDTICTYAFSDRLKDRYTFVFWEQRGCGRTYYRNAGKDPKNLSVSFEKALIDLDKLVDYARERFGKDKVIIMGHSYGTVLGSRYVLAHPEKVSAYIAVAQVVASVDVDMYSYDDALSRAKAAGEDTSELEAALNTYKSSPGIENLLALRQTVSRYHPVTLESRDTWYAVTSPYFGVDDMRWYIKQLGDTSDFIALNQQLMAYTFLFRADDGSMNYDVPVYFISGSEDWVCPVDMVKEYMEKISAPDKDIYVIDGCGHSVQYTLPDRFAQAVGEILERSERQAS